MDATLSELAVTSGPGSVAARQALLGSLFTRATEPEAEFVRSLLTGGLRQGALAGVMTDAVAKAADVPLLARPARRDALRRPRPHGRTGAAARVPRPSRPCSLAVLNPIQPMLAASAGDVAEALGHTGPASVEWKLDGARGPGPP